MSLDYLTPFPSRSMADLSLCIASNTRYSLYDLLNFPLKRFPVPRSKETAASTTNGAVKNFRIRKGRTLEGVVLVPNLLESSVLEASNLAKRFILINSSHQHALYASSIHAKYTEAWNTPEMNSEQDIREWAHVCYVRPALAALHAVTDPSNAQRTDEIAIDIEKYSYVSSGFSVKRDPGSNAGPIMDSFMANGPWVSGTKPKMCMTVEYKSNNALEGNTFTSVTCAPDIGINENSLIPFYWPDENDVQIEKDTKILCQVNFLRTERKTMPHTSHQVYDQMDHSDSQFSWLSSYTTNIFFYKKIRGRELYMSRPYDLASTTPLVIFSWFCRASGLLQGPMTVPTPDYSYYDLITASISKTPYNHGVMT